VNRGRKKKGLKRMPDNFSNSVSKGSKSPRRKKDQDSEKKDTLNDRELNHRFFTHKV